MELSNEVIKKGTSSIPGFRLEYSVTYVDDKVKSISAQVKKLIDSEGVKTEKWVGNASLDLNLNWYTFNFTDYKVVTADDRAAIFADFEKTIKTLL